MQHSHLDFLRFVSAFRDMRVSIKPKKSDMHEKCCIFWYIFRADTILFGWGYDSVSGLARLRFAFLSTKPLKALL